MSELYDKLPLLIQVAIAFGVAFAVAIAWALGRKSNAGDRIDEEEKAEIIRELQEKLLDARFARMEADLRLIIEAMRVGVQTDLHTNIAEMNAKLTDMQRRVEVLMLTARQNGG